jgi:hypothetical protein
LEKNLEHHHHLHQIQDLHLLEKVVFLLVAAAEMAADLEEMAVAEMEHLAVVKDKLEQQTLVAVAVAVETPHNLAAVEDQELY